MSLVNEDDALHFLLQQQEEISHLFLANTNQNSHFWAILGMQRPISNKSFSVKNQNLNKKKKMVFLTPSWSLGKFRWDKEDDEEAAEALSDDVIVNPWR